MVTRVIDTGTDQLLCEVKDSVAVITLNRPEVRNALGDTITPALRRMIRDRGQESDVGALLLTGSHQMLELAINGSPAALTYGIKRNDVVVLEQMEVDRERF